MATIQSVMNYILEAHKLEDADNGAVLKTLKKTAKKYDMFIEVGVRAELQKVVNMSKQGKNVVFFTDKNYNFDIPFKTLKFFISNIKMIKKVA